MDVFICHVSEDKDERVINHGLGKGVTPVVIDTRTKAVPALNIGKAG
jgi:hypothetical protein